MKIDIQTKQEIEEVTIKMSREEFIHLAAVCGKVGGRRKISLFDDIYNHACNFGELVEKDVDGMSSKYTGGISMRGA